MRLYVEVAKRSFQRQLAYRTATLAGLTTNAFWGCLRSFLFLGLYNAASQSVIWNVQEAIDYVWLAQALIMPLTLFGWWEAGETIRSGDVVSDLTKPIDLYLLWLGREAGRAVYNLIFRFLPTIALGLVLFGIRLPPPDRWLPLLITMIFAFWVSFGIRFLLNLSAFWLLDYRGIANLVIIANTLLSGFLLPLTYFPEWSQPLLTWLPFASIVQIPTEVWLGRLTGSALFEAVGRQVFWALLLAVGGQLTVYLGERKLVVQGG